jgi:CHASE2 domain-containing sensor protein
MAPATEHNLTAALGLAEARSAPSNSREETPEFAFKPASLGANSFVAKRYEKPRRELFRPTPEQIRGARAWLVRVVARRAVEILKAQEKAP